MERLKEAVVGGWEIKAWLHRFCKYGAGASFTGFRAKERQSGTVPMISSY